MSSVLVSEPNRPGVLGVITPSMHDPDGNRVLQSFQLLSHSSLCYFRGFRIETFGTVEFPHIFVSLGLWDLKSVLIHLPLVGILPDVRKEVKSPAANKRKQLY